MSAPPLPSPLDYIGLRRFAFYPPIAHPDPNEWVLGIGARSEVQVVNVYSGRELWIPRQYIGAVSETNSSVLVVGLTKALRFREGTIEPQVKQVIQMPSVERKPALLGAHAPYPLHGAPVVAIRLESKSASALNKALMGTCTGAVVMALLAALIAAAIRF